MLKISKKQMNVIYVNNKLGNIKMDYSSIKCGYDYAKDCSVNNYSSIAKDYSQAIIAFYRDVLDLLFAKNYKNAQTLINDWNN